MKITVFAYLVLGLALAPPVLGANLGSNDQLARSNSPFELCPGVVVDGSGSTVHLMHPDGGIDSVAVASGELNWHSNEAAKPLGLYGNTLVAQADTPKVANELEIVLLDAHSGRVERNSVRIDLPSGVRVGVDDGLGSVFLARTLMRQSDLLLYWEHTRSYVRAVPPRPGQGQPHKELAAYRIDLQSSQALSVDPAVFAISTPTLPQPVKSWADSATRASNIVVAGDVLAATQVIRTKEREQIVLKRWDATDASPLADVVLFEGPFLLHFYSADRRHVLVTERAAPGEYAEYEWSVFALGSGQRVARIRHHQSQAKFFVSADAITFVEHPYGRRLNEAWVNQARQLKSVRLRDAKVVWRRPLRDPTYRGPYAP